MMEQIETYCEVDYEPCEYLIVANDATPEVLDYLREHEINHLEYRDPKPDDYYINRVYRAWNFGVENAKTDVVVLINSDMLLSEGWLDNLLRELKEDTIPVSRLVESGKMPSGRHALSVNLGRHCNDIDYGEWEELARILTDLTVNKVEEGGLYMPCAFFKKDFLAVGGYCEGNVYDAGVGRVDSRFKMSGDAYTFHIKMQNKKHITVMDSLVYHIQTGEMNE